LDKRYFITKPSGEVVDVEARGVQYTQNHVGFLDDKGEAFLVFHADDVRLMEIEPIN
jgi:hypothetical protein